MKRFLGIALVVGVATLLVGPAARLVAGGRTSRCAPRVSGMGSPTSIRMGKGARLFADLVDKASGGKIKITVLRQPGARPRFTDALGGAGRGAGVLRREPGDDELPGSRKSASWTCPICWQTPKEAYAIYDGPALDYVNNKLEQAGLVTMGVVGKTGSAS